jgi:hypothetical protein
MGRAEIQQRPPNVRCCCRALRSIAVVWLDSTCIREQVTAWTYDRSQQNLGVDMTGLASRAN